MTSSSIGSIADWGFDSLLLMFGKATDTFSMMAGSSSFLAGNTLNAATPCCECSTSRGSGLSLNDCNSCCFVSYEALDYWRVMSSTGTLTPRSLASTFDMKRFDAVVGIL